LRLNLLPRERRFYTLFEQDIANIHDAAEQLQKLMSRPADAGELQVRIRELEHQGDQLTHEIVRALNRTFVTPFDREDIYALTTGLDDVLDYIDEAAGMVSLYGISDVPTAAVEQTSLLCEAVAELQVAIGKLESLKDLEKHWIEVNSIENQGDNVHRTALGELFRTDGDTMRVLKLKELYGVLEEALDRCEDVANVIENIVIKNA